MTALLFAGSKPMVQFWLLQHRCWSLYRVYEFLCLLKIGSSYLSAIDRVKIPSYHRRVLCHWTTWRYGSERLCRSFHLERGELSDQLSLRYVAYAHANASVGINGMVLNNVNANPGILKRVSGKGESPCRYFPPLWHQGLFIGQLFITQRSGGWKIQIR
jgi:hypothetical protein